MALLARSSLLPLCLSITLAAACDAPGTGGRSSPYVTGGSDPGPVDTSGWSPSEGDAGGSTEPPLDLDAQTSTAPGDVDDATAHVPQDVNLDPAPCSLDPAVSGALAVASGVTFDRVAVDLHHKRDVDAAEDGCLADVRLSFSVGALDDSDCVLVVDAGQAFAPDGGLRVLLATFAAGSRCPGIPDALEGRYAGGAELDLGAVTLSTSRVPDRDAATSCTPLTLDVRLAGTLTADDGRTIEVGASTLRVTGDLASHGETDLACPCAPSCGGRACGDDGCGFGCGACAAGASCDEAGACVAESACGDGVCEAIEIATCPTDCIFCDGVCDVTDPFVCPADCE